MNLGFRLAIVETLISTMCNDEFEKTATKSHRIISTKQVRLSEALMAVMVRDGVGRHYSPKDVVVTWKSRRRFRK